MESMNDNEDVSNLTVDVTDTTKEVIELPDGGSLLPVEENDSAQEEQVWTERNMFYANDALAPPPSSASEADKKRYQQIKKSVKRLRKLEKNPIFIVHMMDLKAQQKILDEMNDEG